MEFYKFKLFELSLRVFLGLISLLLLMMIPHLNLHCTLVTPQMKLRDKKISDSFHFIRLQYGLVTAPLPG